MKNSKLILVLWLGASAWSQTPAQKQQGTPSGRPANTPTVTAAATLSTAPTNVKPPPTNDPAKRPLAAANSAGMQLSKTGAASARVDGTPERPPVQSVGRTNVVGQKPAGPSSVAKAVAVTGRPAHLLIKGRRDPFVSPVVERTRNAVACTGSGKQCLAIGEFTLHGVVRSPGGFIAVVVNGEHTYFLREHDPLADGAVERITKDTIVLRERSSDALGRRLTREVTKKLGSPAV